MCVCACVSCACKSTEELEAGHHVAIAGSTARPLLLLLLLSLPKVGHRALLEELPEVPLAGHVRQPHAPRRHTTWLEGKGKGKWGGRPKMTEEGSQRGVRRR